MTFFYFSRITPPRHAFFLPYHREKMLLYTILLVSIVSTSQACVYSQSYWLSNASLPWPMDTAPLNQPLCGVTWQTLMYLNTSQVRESGSTQWLLAFHQLCTAALNLRTQQQSSSLIPSSVTLSVNAVYDSMERRCDNLSGWVAEQEQDTVLSAHLRTIMQYNHGGEACNPTNSLPFSFTQSPQLFFMGYNETEEEEASRQAEVMAHIYKIQGSMVVYSSLVTFFIIPALAIYIIILRNKRREYSWFMASEESTVYNVSGVDDNVILDTEDDDDDDANHSNDFEPSSPRPVKQKDQ